MIVIPPLLPCPSCGLAIQAGENPHGLAWHDCQESIQGEGSEEVLAAECRKRDLSAEGAAVALARMLLHTGLMHPDLIDMRGVGMAIAGLGKVMDTVEGETSDDALRLFIQGGGRE